MADMKAARREITKARRAARTQAKREFKLAPLSGVIRLAIADLEAVENDKRYVVNMDQWHLPKGLSRLFGFFSEMQDAGADCVVCFAGAVMAHRFGADRDLLVCPGNYEPAVRDRLQALNAVRYGDFEAAADYMDLDVAAVRKAVGRINIPAYGPKTRSRFKIQLLNAAARLEKAGL